MSPYNFFLCLSTTILVISFMGFLCRTVYARFHTCTYPIKMNNLIGAEIGGTLGLMIKDDKSTSKNDTDLNLFRNDTHTRNVTYLRTKGQAIQYWSDVWYFIRPLFGNTKVKHLAEREWNRWTEFYLLNHVPYCKLKASLISVFCGRRCNYRLNDLAVMMRLLHNTSQSILRTQNWLQF